MKASKPIVLFIANRREYFSRQLLRGIISMRGDGCDWEVWLMPMVNERRHLEACLDSREVSGVIGRGLNNKLLGLLNERNVPVVAIRGMETANDDLANGPHVNDEAIGEKAGGEFMRLNLGYWGLCIGRA